MLIFTDEEKEEKPLTIREYKYSNDKIDMIDHINISKLPDAKRFSMVDPEGRFFALMLGNNERGAKENLLANKLMIWDITNRKTSSEDKDPTKGFVLIEKFTDPFYNKEMHSSRLHKMNFIKLNGTDTSYIWLTSYMNYITKNIEFCIFSLKDHKIIFRQTVKNDIENSEIELLFDQTNDFIYYIGKQCIKRS